MKGDVIQKPEMNYHILVYVTVPLLICNTYDLNSSMTVPVEPYRVKGETNDVSLDVYPKMRKKVVFSPPYFFLDYKM